MHWLKTAVAGLAVIETSYAVPYAPKSPRAVMPKIQHFPRQAYGSSNVSDKAQAVIDAFVFAFDNYYQYAFPADQLNPISLTSVSPYGGWAASAVDGLDTAIVMGLSNITQTIVDYVPQINWAMPADLQEISLFETTIRYIGGLISSYDLLTGPVTNLGVNQSSIDGLLAQATNLANNLSYAFDTPSGIPANGLFPNNQTTDGGTTNGLATIGTLVMEWTRLSDLTGNTTYAEISQKAENYLINPTPAEDEPFPGLVGTDVYLSNGSFLDADGGWVGGDDSFYEYLIKMYVYDQSRFGAYKDFWVQSAESTIADLQSHPMNTTQSNLTYIAEFNFTNLILESEHLACFAGGNFILGGKVLGRQDFIDFGLAFTDACHNTYASTATQIGPEVWDWDASAVPADQADFYNEHGFYITAADYVLRPEVIESYYYAYQVTGNTTYQDWAWDAFVAINATCRVEGGFSEINNVNVAGGGGFGDNQQSFLFAELLKYSYLIQAPPAVYDVENGGTNQWVFNTEAHPFKVAGTPI